MFVRFFFLNMAQLHALEVLQNRAVGVILQHPRRTNCQDMLDCLNMINVLFINLKNDMY